MKLIKARYIVTGHKQGKSGGMVKVFSKRLLLECEVCGKQVIRRSFVCIKQRSCGCVPANLIHGYSRKNQVHPLYRTWVEMKSRCNDKALKRYGGRGISYCHQWESFQPFMSWALLNGWKAGLYIDRKDNDGNYNPSNCRFVTSAESRRNTSKTKLTHEKAEAIRQLRKTGMTYKAIGKVFGVSYITVRDVIFHAWRKAI